MLTCRAGRALACGAVTKSSEHGHGPSFRPARGSEGSQGRSHQWLWHPSQASGSLEWWPPSVRAVLACSVPGEASEQVDDLITSCMAKDPQARPSAVDLVKLVGAQ